MAAPTAHPSSPRAIPTRGRPKAFDREEVLEKALELFWEKGYNSIGVREISQHMGIGKQSLYDTFGDKRSLYLEALRLYGKNRLELVRQLLGESASPAAGIRAFLAMWKNEALGENGASGCMLVNSSTELGHADPEVANLVQQKMASLEKLLADTFEKAHEAGEMIGTANPAALARLIMITGNGLAAASHLGLDGPTVDDVIQTLESLLLRSPDGSAREAE